MYSLGFYNTEAKSLGARWFTVLAVIAIVLVVTVGGLLVTNYQHIGNLIKVISLVRTQYLYPVEPAQLVDGAIKGIVNSLNDPYSVYLEPKTFSQLRDQIKGSFWRSGHPGRC